MMIYLSNRGHCELHRLAGEISNNSEDSRRSPTEFHKNAAGRGTGGHKEIKR